MTPENSQLFQPSPASDGIKKKQGSATEVEVPDGIARRQSLGSGWLPGCQQAPMVRRLDPIIAEEEVEH